jgi:iron-sulfur cluster assembly protein
MTICTITDTAKLQINTICEENAVYGVSLNLKGGGCAGFEYDWVIDAGVGKFIIGSTSLMFLFGTEVDFVKSIVGSNFEIRNPNSTSSCGCGVSVNFDVDKLAQPVI